MSERLGPRFSRVLTASALSNLADGVAKVALPLIAVRFTESPLLVGGLAVSVSLPWLLCSLPAGALVDRIDRRAMMLAANGARAAVAALLAALLGFGTGGIVVLYLAALLAGIAEVLYDTASQSILPQVVTRDHLTRANSRLYGVEIAANQFVGPPLGGLLVGLGIALAVGTPAALWALAVLVLAAVRGDYRPGRSQTATLRADIAEGLRFLFRHRVLRALALMTGAGNLAAAMGFSVFVLYAVGDRSPMGLTDAQFGLLMATTAVGAVIGSLVATRVNAALGRAASLGASMITFTLMAGIPALTANPWVIGGVYLLSGVGVMLWNIIAVSLRQLVTPNQLLGRTNSCYRLLAWGVQPIGALLGGALGEALGLRPVFVVAAAVALLSGLGLFVVTNTAIDEAEAEAVAAAATSERAAQAPAG